MDLTPVGEAAGELLEEVGELTGLDPKMAAVAIFVLALLAVFLFTKPIRWILKLLINTGIGSPAWRCCWPCGGPALCEAAYEKSADFRSLPRHWRGLRQGAGRRRL